MENHENNTKKSGSNLKGTSSIKLTTKQALQLIDFTPNKSDACSPICSQFKHRTGSHKEKADSGDLNDNPSFELKELRLVHASQCKDKHCLDVFCQKTKWLINHPSTCRNQNVCLLCKKLLEIASHHASNCPESKCGVIYCTQIKRRFRQIQVQQIHQKIIEKATVEALPREFNLVHAYKCTAQKCNEPHCLNTKWLINHSQNCNILKGCTTCKKLFLQCTNHAKCCTNTKCTVLYCKHIKDKFSQLQLGIKNEEEPPIKIFVHNSKDPAKSIVELNTNNCKKTTGRCPICLLVLAICCFHAKHCQKQNCSVPFCSPIKHKLKNEEPIPQSL